MERGAEIIKDATPCAKCKHKPVIIHYDIDMYYARCSNPACKRFGNYDLLGRSKETALKAWELSNRPMARGKKDAFDDK